MYQLPELPYAYDALEPIVDTRTMELHHGVHHRAYVTGANRTLGSLAEARDARAFGAIGGLERDLAFHVSGHVLHSRFWESMSPRHTEPDAALSAAIERDFGSLPSLRDQMTAAATGVQGSGWAILGWEPELGRLLVAQVHDHQDVAVAGMTPLLVVDVWEHAYYLKHQNRRADWIAAFWEVADWSHASETFARLSLTPVS